MTLRPRAATLLAAALGLLAGACGGSLYDAAGVPKVDVAGCLPGTHLCNGGCKADDAVDACGPTCLDCTGHPAPPTGAPACVQVGGAWGCGFKCTLPERACVARDACLADDVNACGADCQVCTAPANAVPTCAPATTGGGNQCGYACKEGFFACDSGCCQPTAVAAGGDQACALTSGGGLSCWGANGSGQLGRAAAASLPPGPVATMSNGVTSLAVGGHHACAVRGGTVWCWGDDTHGQLGNGAVNSSGPAPVSTGLAGATQLVAGSGHTCALVGGGVRCWGDNTRGQLGTGGTGGQVDVPPASGIAGLSGVAALAAFGDTTCALVGGAVRCWGDNATGQASPGGAAVVNAPAAPIALAGTATAVAVGGTHACAIVTGAAQAADDGLTCWGANDAGQLGLGVIGAQSGPVQAGRLDNAQAARVMAAGGAFTCGSTDGIELLCNGRNDQSQCGAAASANVLDRVAVSLGGGTVTQVALGLAHGCALMDQGVAGLAVSCWGGNALGQLGRDPLLASRVAGQPVPGPP